MARVVRWLGLKEGPDSDPAPQIEAMREDVERQVRELRHDTRSHAQKSISASRHMRRSLAEAPIERIASVIAMTSRR